jgi:hypothetical protein
MVNSVCKHTDIFNRKLFSVPDDLYLLKTVILKRSLFVQTPSDIIVI